MKVHIKDNISIHSLFTEGDVSGIVDGALSRRFQSTPSLQRETYWGAEQFNLFEQFQSTPSLQRETRNGKYDS